MKRSISFIVGLVILMTLLCGCGTSNSSKRVSNEEIRAAANNMFGKGDDVATDGNWLFYPNNRQLCCIRLDGGEEKILLSEYDVDSTLYFVGGNLYQTEQMLSPDIWIDDQQDFASLNLWGVEAKCFQTDGESYYINYIDSASDLYGGEGVYRMDAENKENYIKLMDAMAQRLILQGEYLYVLSSADIVNGRDNHYKGTWQVNLDGSGYNQVLDFCPRYFLVTEDRIFYTQDEAIWGMNLDGTQKYLVTEKDPEWGFNTAGDYLFYIDYDSYGIHRINKDGSGDVELSSQRCMELYVAGNWLVYRDWDTDVWYKMSFDGTVCYPVDESIDDYSQDEVMVIESEEDQEGEQVETEDGPRGKYTLEECKENGNGFYVMYPDGTFDKYYQGGVLTWEGPHLMWQRGNDYYPQDMIIHYMQDVANSINMNANDGQIVLFCDNDDYVEKGLYSVEYSGYTVGNGSEAWFFRDSNVKTNVDYWERGNSIHNNYHDCERINGMTLEEFCHTVDSENVNQYVSLPVGDEYTIGIADGTTLVEKVMSVEYRYVFQNNDDYYPLELTPTVDGYAIVDLSNLPSGQEYVMVYSYWDDGRVALITSVYIP